MRPGQPRTWDHGHEGAIPMSYKPRRERRAAGGKAVGAETRNEEGNLQRQGFACG